MCMRYDVMQSDFSLQATGGFQLVTFMDHISEPNIASIQSTSHNQS